MTLRDDQTKLLYHDEYIHFVHADGTDWEFGRRIPLESYLALQLMAEQSLQEAVDVYHQMVAVHLIPTWIYRADVIGKEYRVCSIHDLLPIGAELFAQIKLVDFDLRRAPVGVVAQLQEVISKIQS